MKISHPIPITPDDMWIKYSFEQNWIHRETFPQNHCCHIDTYIYIFAYEHSNNSMWLELFQYNQSYWLDIWMRFMQNIQCKFVCLSFSNCLIWLFWIRVQFELLIIWNLNFPPRKSMKIVLWFNDPTKIRENFTLLPLKCKHCKKWFSSINKLPQYCILSR